MLTALLLLTAAPVEAAAAPQPAMATTPMVQRTSEDGFTTGKNTIQDVVKKLGRPNSTETNSDGTVTIRYATIHTHVKGTSFIPVVGLFAGGAKSKSVTKSFTFGSDGLLRSFSSGDFEAECSTLGKCN